MGETITVRDHARPCEHGSLWPHWFEIRKGKWWQTPDCFGGHEMVLRNEGDGLWRAVRT